MKHPFLVLACLLAPAAAGAATVAFAQDSNPPPTQRPGQTGKPAQDKPDPAGTNKPGANAQGSTAQGAANSAQRLKLRPGEEFIGMPLSQKIGEPVGTVRDLVLRPDGTIAHLIVDSPSAASGNAYYPVPWGQVEYGMQLPNGASSGDAQDMAQSQGRLVARFEGDRLRTAPSFDRTRWPADNTLFDESERYFGGDSKTGKPVADGGTPDGKMDKGVVPASADKMTRMRASQLRDKEVVDSSGAVIGRIGRYSIDPVQGRVNYVALGLTNVPGASGRTIAVPWSALKTVRKGESSSLQLGMPADQLQNAPQFKSNSDAWGEMSDPNWIRSMYAFYRVEPYWDSNASRDAGSRDGQGKSRDGKDSGEGAREDRQKDPPQEKRPGETPPRR